MNNNNENDLNNNINENKNERNENNNNNNNEEKKKNEEIFQFEFESKECSTESVTIFSDRAEITRMIEIKESKIGQQEVIINGLPKGIKSESIHVAGGKGSATVLEVSYEIIYRDLIKSGERDILSNQIEEKQDQIKEEELKKERLEAERSLLEKYSSKIFDKNPSNSLSSSSASSISHLVSESNLNGVSNYLQFVSENTSRLDDAFLQNRRKIKQLNKEIGDMRKILQLMSLNSSTKEESRRVTIAFITNKVTPVQFGLVYVVDGASWEPSYDVRITSASGAKEEEEAKLALTYYGKIQQNTGEDWTNARLLLSTAVPSSATNAPQATPRVLQFYRPPSPRMWAMPSSQSRSSSLMAPSCSLPPEAMMDEMTGGAPPPPEPEPELEIQTASTKKNDISATFEIPRRSTIDSDNKPHKVTITILDLKPRMEYFTVPRVNDNAYLRALAKNTTEVALLPGPASVFLDGDFIATSDLALASSGSEYQFLLGVDSDIRIKHEEVKTTSSQSGLIKKTKEVNVEHKTAITNTKKNPIHIVVMDSLPLSKEDNIKVKMDEPELKKSPNVSLDEHSGKLSWNLDVAAGSTVNVPFKFRVDYPADKNIVGLDETEK